MTNLLLILLLLVGCLSARTSSPINLSKVNSVYYKTGQADYTIFGNKKFEEYGILLSKFTKSKSHFIDIGFKYNNMEALLASPNNKVIAKTLIFNVHSPRILFLNPIISYEFQEEKLKYTTDFEPNVLNLQKQSSITTHHNQIFSISSIHKITSRLNLSLATSILLTEQVKYYVESIYFDDESNMRDTPTNDMLTKVGGTYKYEYYRANLSLYFLLHENLLLSSDISFSTHDTRERNLSLSIIFQI